VLSSRNVGSTTLRATFKNVEATPVPITVTPATLVSIDITPVDEILISYSLLDPTGVPVQFKAIGTFSDTITQDITQNVTWSAGDSDWVSISNDAQSKGVAHGNKFPFNECHHTTIKATLSGVEANVPVRVKHTWASC
jgi:trimeric autotransporter adhesin